MIEIRSDSPPKNFDNQILTHIKSIIITTDAGDVILTPCKDAVVSLMTTEKFGSLDCLSRKEVIIETQYDNMIVIK